MTNEKELLRITDEETGYDLVAVQNPHGDFGISTFAENEDGRQPVDGKYMLARMIGQGGGGQVVTLYTSNRQGPNGDDFLVFNQDDQGIAFDPDDPRIASSDDIIKLFNSGLVIISHFGVYVIMNEITRQMAAEGLYAYAVHSTSNGASHYRFITRDFVPEDNPPS